ncbi:MAG: aldo/keto reductase [Gammaproteobacteria bacterium]|nr:aldo/keto reductase [Gammaproteobacteria bacterium]
MQRRDFLLSLAASTAILACPAIASKTLLKRPIPSSGEQIPSVGMGTWITFDVGTKKSIIDDRTEVLKHFFANGGGMIDSSPMYGTAQTVLGKCFQQLEPPKSLFSATKVWTPGKWLGIQQMEASEELWGLNSFDLMQVHNLVDWKTHLKTLREWKESKRIRYLGITTSHGRRHRELIKIMQTEPLDFVQFTYNINHTEAKKELLPLAVDKGIAVIINRPFDGGNLFKKIENEPLPDWAKEFDCHNWAQYFLKFILSHPAVTVAIPATSRADHMDENMGALTGLLPDAAMRKRMLLHYQSI